jgi:NAD(P)-dependent dehydrogenase (short-subunit alcohol dehydrogenase family)
LRNGRIITSGLFSLSGRAVVVTGAGANGGIGHAIALGYARAGARLVICDIDADGLARTAEELSSLGALAAAELCDISEPTQVEKLFATADSALGRVDILVNVPFCFPRRTAPHEVTLEDWERMFAVNVTGYFLCIRAAVKRMLAQGQGGAIINIGSNAGGIVRSFV